jgi:hypothetical protein
MRKLLVEVDCGREFCEDCKLLRFASQTHRVCSLYGTLSAVSFVGDPTLRAVRAHQCLDAEERRDGQ